MSAARARRLLRLISLLRSDRALAAEQLIGELGVSRRTVFRDLKALELMGVPCRYDPEQRTYTIDESFALPALNLTADEAAALLLVARRFGSPQLLPTFDVAARAADKLEAALPAKIRQFCKGMAEAVTVRLPPLVDVGRVDQVFQKLHRAAGEGHKVRVQYDSYFEGQTIETDVSPYQLLFIGRAWYLVGLSSLHDEVRTFKLDRLVSADVLDEPLEPDPEFDVDVHLGDAWQMIPEGRVRHIRLRFLPKVAGNVEEIAWHKTQRFTALPDGSCLFEADVDGLGEITWWILGYGDQVVVEDPPELRERIGQIALRIAELAGARGPDASAPDAPA